MRAIRNMRDEDLPFIYATWLKSQRYSNKWFEEIDSDCFYEGFKRLIDIRLKSSQVRISCLESDPDVALGYSCFSADEKVLHYVYVKKAWRRFGIFKELVPSTIEEISSITKMGKLMKGKYGWKFNPFK